jgi:hypothetical protein
VEVSQALEHFSLCVLPRTIQPGLCPCCNGITINLLPGQAHVKQEYNFCLAGNLGTSWLLQGIRGLWRLCCAIVFCNCFGDYFRPAALTRLLDDADYVLAAHPHRAVRVVLYPISV